jgi:frataxin-like iron-binding protein CyaY
MSEAKKPKRRQRAKPRKARPTKAIVAQRIEEVLRIRLDGAEFWDVLQYIAEKQQESESIWAAPDGGKPFASRTIWWYIHKADQLLAETFRNEAGRKKLRRRHLAQRRNLYAKAVSQGDIRAALAVLDSEAKIIGLFAPVKVAPTDPQGDRPYGPLTDADRAAALARLYAAVGPGDRGPAADGRAIDG